MKGYLKCYRYRSILLKLSKRLDNICFFTRKSRKINKKLQKNLDFSKIEANQKFSEYEIKVTKFAKDFKVLKCELF